MCVVQLLLLMFGIWLMTRARLRFGRFEIRSPFTAFTGLILIMQLPIGMGIGMAIGGAEGIKAARQGVDPSEFAVGFAMKYWWLDIAVTATALAVAAIIGYGGLREIRFLPPPPDDPIGVTDYRLIDLESWDAPNEGEH